ncbi:MAG: glycosyltransferase family 4 protein [Oscillospiraceae bacterium]|nr:glycosyltransferase family 4 protein [Oscillospiraceae bacterium]
MKKKKITCVNHYNVFPFNHGGALAILGLSNGLSEWFDVSIICFNEYDIYYDVVELNENLRVYSIAKPSLFKEQEKEYFTNEIANDCISFSRYMSDIVSVANIVRTISSDSDIIIVEHPYVFKLIKKIYGNSKTIWYRAHNVEYNYALATYNDNNDKQKIADEIFNIEHECCEDVDLILTISQIDADILSELYGISHNKILNISAGYDFKESDFVLPSIKASKKNSRFDALFISSAAPMAIKAVDKLISFAEMIPLVHFNIIGSVGMPFINIALPKNVTVTGLVDEDTKISYLETADLAVNLIESGSGLNIKVFEFFAYGIPVISTNFGMRGIKAENGKDFVLTNSGTIMNDIEIFRQMEMNKKDALALNAFNLLIREYSWHHVARKVASIIDDTGSFSSHDVSIKYDKTNIINRFTQRSNEVSIDKAIIWGSGVHGIACLDALYKKGVDIIGFIDNDESKWKKVIKGYKVYSPNEYYKFYSDNTVVIAVDRFYEIIAQIAREGIKEKDIKLCHNGDLNPYYYDETKIMKMFASIYASVTT